MDANATKFEEIYAHRISNYRRDGKWHVWDLTVSERTAWKFHERARKAGLRCFLRNGRAGCLAADAD